MKIGFSTLGCPNWSLEHACAQARELGYDGVELRFIDGQVVNTELAAADRDRVRDVLSRSGVDVSALGTSVKLTGADPEQTTADLRAGLELAAHWSIPQVRVFGGRLLEGESRAQAIERAAGVVTRALPDAERLNVGIALETHDDFSAAADAGGLLKAVDSARFGVIWDLQHTWRAGDQPDRAWELMGRYVIEVHVKDGYETDNGWQQVGLGAGEVPVSACLERALRDGFDGWLVVEWEKAWHPELAEPEVAFPAHRSALGSILDALPSA